jgi:glycerophosphoryl diester phosphodiesterase
MNIIKDTVITITLAFLFTTSAEAIGANGWKVNDVLHGDTIPFAIAHRGFGTNLGEEPSRPLENTISAVRLGFLSGVSMVEIDVQVTQDGHVVVFHDDVLADGTCINALTFKQLRRAAREVPQIPTLKRILQEARRFSHSKEGPSGILDIEIKAPSPNCDPNDISESKLVEAVVDDIERANMGLQVLIESFSPAILALVADSAPEIARVLSVNVLQFLTPEQVAQATGYEAIIIDKNAGFGLQWANIGGVFRLPGYDSIEEFIHVALGLSSTAVDLDIRILQQAELSNSGSGGLLVNCLNHFGLSVWSFTAANQADWEFLSSIGIEGIVIDDVPLGVALQ